MLGSPLNLAPSHHCHTRLAPQSRDCAETPLRGFNPDSDRLAEPSRIGLVRREPHLAQIPLMGLDATARRERAKSLLAQCRLVGSVKKPRVLEIPIVGNDV